MSCFECNNTGEFAYDNFSQMPICLNCAVVYALKKTFQRYGMEKNEFLDKSITSYKNLLDDKA